MKTVPKGVIYWGTFPDREEEIAHLENALKKNGVLEEHILVPFRVGDWNRDFSPWEAPAVYGEQEFGGKGADTLRWLLEKYVPDVAEQYGPGIKQYIAGYSLAGLFALWAAYETNVFDGVISCSGSLWYPKWDEYVNNHVIQKKCDIYLSLGTKEKKTKNKVMAQVGERTRHQEQILKKDPNVSNVVLDWNPGGHFTDPMERLVKGIRWMCLNK